MKVGDWVRHRTHSHYGLGNVSGTSIADPAMHFVRWENGYALWHYRDELQARPVLWEEGLIPVPPDEMPRYAPPPGIEADGPPEEVDGFRLRYSTGAVGRAFFTGDPITPEQWRFIARFADTQAKRGGA